MGYKILNGADYMCIGFANAAIAASLNASLNVGCKCRGECRMVPEGTDTYMGMTRPRNILSARTILNGQRTL